MRRFAVYVRGGAVLVSDELERTPEQHEWRDRRQS